MGTNYIDLTGQRFGHWTVLEKGNKRTNGDTYWLCRCDCGEVKEVCGKSLRRGRSTNCGCSNSWKKFQGAMGREPRLGKTWRNMMSRCYDQNTPTYRNYGGRGITVCEEWHDLRNFIKWAYESGYSNDADPYECTLDRIDNDGNYQPDNCRWTSVSVQQNNKRTNIRLTVGNETKTIAQWARQIGINRSTVGYWYHRYGKKEAENRIASMIGE